ncbi:hypothetical protein ACFPN2_33425 [Steroidobacter flavus]|uniref:Neuromedin U n=1 Tax=Steroidobacter flavus TaxID=1842136 RepID=A0ABV8T5L4_9GAMM
MFKLNFLIALTVVVASAALAEEAATNASNQANNPLQPSIMLNVNDYYIPSLYGLPDRDANIALVRGLVPHLAFDHPQLLRFTLPINTTPTFPNGHDSGLGDLTIFNMALFQNKRHGLAWGVGPVLTAPTASEDSLGTGKWQGGASGAVVAVRSWGLAGALVIAQDSFAGDDDRRDAGSATVQPIVFYNLPHGAYLRSTGIWSFDLHSDDYYVPVGLGVGKVWSMAPKVQVNGFVEPQFTVLHEGIAPHWQLYVGFNVQYLL